MTNNHSLRNCMDLFIYDTLVSSSMFRSPGLLIGNVSELSRVCTVLLLTLFGGVIWLDCSLIKHLSVDPGNWIVFALCKASILPWFDFDWIWFIAVASCARPLCLILHHRTMKNRCRLAAQSLLLAVHITRTKYHLLPTPIKVAFCNVIPTKCC